MGVWTSTDPADQFFSPYAYAGNGYNPINGVDSDGNYMKSGVAGQDARDREISARLDRGIDAGRLDRGGRVDEDRMVAEINSAELVSNMRLRVVMEKYQESIRQTLSNNGAPGLQYCNFLNKAKLGFDVAGFFFEPADWVSAGISAMQGEWDEVGYSLLASVPIAGSLGKGVFKYGDDLLGLAGKSGAQIGKNAVKMSNEQIGKFLNAGKNWHKTSAKEKFLNFFKKELKGDTNADFYIDKKTKEVFLKSNHSGNWIKTGEFFE